jgi:DNA-directed RNA polymerase subunit RPC12/RpoP
MRRKIIESSELIRALGSRTRAGIPLTCLGYLRKDMPSPEYIQCQECGYDKVEIWNDEASTMCDRCGSTVMMPRSLLRIRHVCNLSYKR